MAKRSKRTKPSGASAPAASPARAKPRPVRPYGSLRLRRLLKLSDQVDLETLCDEAADEIDQLPSEPQSKPLRSAFGRARI